MRKLFAITMIATVALAVVLPSRAQNVPTRDSVTITNATSCTFTVPHYQNGSLARCDIYRLTPLTNSVDVKLIQTVGTLTVTNQVAYMTAVAGTNTTTLSSVYLMPGDVLLFTPSSAATGTVSFVRLVGD